MPDELVEVLKENPEGTHALVRLDEGRLGVSIVLNERTFDLLWGILERHIGDKPLLCEITMPVLGFGDPQSHPDAIDRRALAAGEPYVSTASFGIEHSRWLEVDA